jgi:hypothetical protein
LGSIETSKKGIIHMQKWEYTFVTLNPVGAVWKPRFVNGKELSNWEGGATVYEFSNKMGNEGWELVAAPFTIGSNEYAWRLVFKRTTA